MDLNKYIMESIWVLNEIVEEYQSKFGNVGLKKLPESIVNLIPRNRLRPEEIDAIGFYIVDEDELYICRENFSNYLERHKKSLSRWKFGDEKWESDDDIQRYFALTLLCHEGVIHRSCKFRALSSSAQKLYKFILHNAYDEDLTLSINEFTIKSHGLALYLCMEDGDKIELEYVMDEAVAHALSAKIIGLYLSKVLDISSYLPAQSIPLSFLDEKFEDEEVRNVALTLDKSPSINEFIRDYLEGIIPERVTQKVRETPLEGGSNPEFYQVLFAPVASDIQSFPEFYRILYEA